MVPVEFLHQCFRLDQVTGRLVWRHRPREHFATNRSYSHFLKKYVGEYADSRIEKRDGYRQVRVFFRGVRYGYGAHRVVYALVHGQWPMQEIDHIDRVRTNNRPENLRDVTHLENMANSVYPRPRRQALQAA